LGEEFWRNGKQQVFTVVLELSLREHYHFFSGLQLGELGSLTLPDPQNYSS